MTSDSAGSARDRLLCVLRGGKADRVPFTIYKWLLPQTDTAALLVKQGLTLIDASQVYSERSEQVRTERWDVMEQGERKTVMRITTPVGELTEVTRYDPSFGSPWVEKHLLSNIDEFRIMQFALQHTVCAPACDGFIRQDREIGQRGIVLGQILPAPIAWMWVQLMGAEVWCEHLTAHTDAFDELHAAQLAAYRRQVDIAADSPAEIIWLPDNVTADMISPKTFRKYCVPAYEYACRTLHQAGKRTFAHYDGKNRPLAQCLADTEIDILEAFTPRPMGDMTVAEARAAWPGKVLGVNFPGSLFHEDVGVIESYARRYLEEAGSREGFTVGCTEDFDPALFEHAFSAIGRVINADYRA